ncbi:hypothetical protein F6455_01995 [Proteobacteria bacterium 005FR1]|nr:hypothetical protein [Proteobacteria bacterium 005FR1]
MKALRYGSKARIGVFSSRAIAVSAMCLLSSLATAQDLSASLADPAWTGDGIPQGQQCQRFGGQNPESPEVKIENIPQGTQAIVLAFSDRSFERMDNGGHGMVAYKLSGEHSGSVTIPSVPGHTENLPNGFFTVQAHQAPGWDKAGAYLPPCSGGRGNNYFIDIKAVKLAGDQQVGETLAETSVKMATY